MSENKLPTDASEMPHELWNNERWLRNIAVAMGNALRHADEPGVRAALQSRVEDKSALVREHVAWALAQSALIYTW